MGYWRDLVYEDTIATDHSYFSLPDTADSLLAATVDDNSTQIRSLWHDYKISGTGSLTNFNGPDPLYGIVDDGYSPTIIDLDREKEHVLYIRPMKEGDMLPDCGRVIATFITSDGDLDEEVFQMDESMSITGTKNNGSRITSVIYENIPFPVKLVAVDTDNVGTVDFDVASEDWSNGVILTLARAEGNEALRYRRYRMSNTNNETRNVRVLLKRAFKPLNNVNDIVHLGNLNVIKHGLLGFIAEDNADVERANYHWGTCKMLLEDEMDAHRGAAKPTMKINFAGAGSSPIPNLM